MALAFVLDEHLRGVLWIAIQRHNSYGGSPIDIVCVGDPPDLPLGSSDPDILTWSERNGRILISRDFSTMITFFARHLQAGNHSPGLIFLRRRWTIPTVIAALEIAANAGEPADFIDQVNYIP